METLRQVSSILKTFAIEGGFYKFIIVTASACVVISLEGDLMPVVCNSKHVLVCQHSVLRLVSVVWFALD